MAHQALKHLAPNGDKRISLDSIIKAVAADANLNPAQLKQKTNERRISRPRQIAMYLAKQLTHASLPEIGRALGGKHHTTVLHAIDVVERLRQTDAELNNRIHGLMDSLQ
jgi:chromosomal replication initiator protein